MEAQQLSITNLLSQPQTGGTQSLIRWQFISKLISDCGISQLVASLILCSLSNRTELKSIAIVASLLKKRTFSWESDHLSHFPSVNVVGTGKSRTKSFNLSTATSFLLAAKGWTVLKHGGVRVSSNCGASDLLRKLRLALPPNQTEGTVLPSEIATGWVSSDPSLRFLSAINPIRRKATKSYFLNLVLATLNLPNAGCSLIGTSNCQTGKMTLLTAGTVGTRRVWCISSLSGTDKPTSISPTLLITLRANQLSKVLFSFEKAGSETSEPRAPKTLDSQQFLRSFLSVAAGLKGPTSLVLALGGTVTSTVWDADSTYHEVISRTLSILAGGEAFLQISNFVRTNGKDVLQGRKVFQLGDVLSQPHI